MTLHEALRAAFLPDCRDGVERGTLTGTTAEDMADELAAGVIEVNEWNQAKPHPDTVLENVIYLGTVRVCERREFAARRGGEPGYSGNGHHWAQRLAALAAGSAAVREAMGTR